MANWRDNLISLEPYVAGEQKRVKGLIKLNTNENPFSPSPRVGRAISGFNADNLARYPDPKSGYLASVLAEQNRVSAGNVFVGNGSDEILAFAFRAFFNSNVPILLPDVTYSFYPVWCRLFGIPYEEVPVGDDFRIDARDYERESGGIVIANPNAPTGIAEGNEFFERVLKANPQCVVVVDEAYVGFGAQSVLSLIGKYENLFVTRTFSKSKSLAGLRIGVGFGCADLISAIGAVKDSFNSYPVGSLQEAAAVAAAEDESYYEAQSEKLIGIRSGFTESMRSLGFTVCDSSANFVFVTHPNIRAKDLYLWLKARDILVRWFDKPRIGEYLRITIGRENDMAALLSKVGEYISGRGY